MQKAPQKNNPVGSYKTDFDVPVDWEGRKTYLHFDGVDSAYYSDSNGDDFTEHECAEAEPCQWLGETNDLNLTSAIKGTTFEIEIEYRAYFFIKFYGRNLLWGTG